MIRLHQFSTLSRELNWIEFLDYKFTASKFDINSRVFIRLQLYKRKVIFSNRIFLLISLSVQEARKFASWGQIWHVYKAA
jgi:hypothetical protein